MPPIKIVWGTAIDLVAAFGIINIKYFLTAILFVLFDVEVIFFYAYAVNFREMGLSGFLAVLMFVGVFLLGFVALVGLPVFAVLLMVTIIGLPLALVVMLL